MTTPSRSRALALEWSMRSKYYISYLSLFSLISAATINIPADLSTIQAGIDASSDGDTVLVSAGTYVENINFNGKNIVVQGENRETTIIDGNQSGSVVTFNGGENENALLSGFTINNGNGNMGGGVSIGANVSSSPSIINNIIINLYINFNFMKTNQIKFFILLCFAFFILSNSYGFSYKELHEFEIYRNGKKIGFNKLYFKKIDNKIVVNTKIETVIKFGFISIFKYFHNSKEFFIVEGLRIKETRSREVNYWDQPILTQVGYKGGIVGIIRKRFNGIPHYLIEAKLEPGNYKYVQLSPTLQATFSNLRRAHRGRKPRFMNYFENKKNKKNKILLKKWGAEDGGRLNRKRNLSMLVEIPENEKIKVTNEFIWMSMWQIKECLKFDSWINPHIRGIISHF